jgi:hypothetical protein
MRAKASVELTDLVPATSIAPEGEASWPFITVETPRFRPLRASCVRGATASFDCHAFAGPRFENGALVETAYDHASRIGGTLEKAVGDRRITLENGAICRFAFSDGQMLRDQEPDSWHWFAQLNARVLA